MKKPPIGRLFFSYLLGFGGLLSLPPPDGFPVVLGQPPLPFPMVVKFKGFNIKSILFASTVPFWEMFTVSIFAYIDFLFYHGSFFMEAIEQFNSFCQTAIEALDEAREKGPRKHLTINIPCGSLKEEWDRIDIRDSEEYQQAFKDLMAIQGPVVYYFEIVNRSVSNEDIYEAIKAYSNKPESRNTTAVKKHCDPETSILYVGKVKGGVWGRLIQHLGYYRQKGTGALQLYHWAKEIKLELKMHVFEFEQEMADLVGFMEYKMAKELKPLLGKHK